MSCFFFRDLNLNYNLFYIVLKNGPKVSELLCQCLTDINIFSRNVIICNYNITQDAHHPEIYVITGWWRGTVVERRFLAGELSLSCARPAADG